MRMMRFMANGVPWKRMVGGRKSLIDGNSIPLASASVVTAVNPIPAIPATIPPPET
jgi:hypothetical protein